MSETHVAATPKAFFGTFWAALRGGFLQIGETNLALVSAGVGFFGMLSLFPALAALIAVLGLISDAAVVVTQLEVLRELLKEEGVAL